MRDSTRLEGARYKISAARNYLILAAIRNVVMGFFMVWYPEKFTSPAFKALFALAPCQLWGYMMLSAAAMIVLALFLRDTLRARIGLVIGSACLVAIGVSATTAILVDGQDTGGLFAIIVFFVMAGKDLVLVNTSFVDIGRGYGYAERAAHEENQEQAERDNGDS